MPSQLRSVANAFVRGPAAADGRENHGIVTTKASLYTTVLAVFIRTSLPGSDTTGLILGPIPSA